MKVLMVNGSPHKESAIDLLDEASATVQGRIKKEAKREITPLDD